MTPIKETESREPDPHLFLKDIRERWDISEMLHEAIKTNLELYLDDYALETESTSNLQQARITHLSVNLGLNHAWVSTITHHTIQAMAESQSFSHIVTASYKDWLPPTCTMPQRAMAVYLATLIITLNQSESN